VCGGLWRKAELQSVADFAWSIARNHDGVQRAWRRGEWPIKDPDARSIVEEANAASNAVHDWLPFRLFRHYREQKQ
jgi:hypothetical protein